MKAAVQGEEWMEPLKQQEAKTLYFGSHTQVEPSALPELAAQIFVSLVVYLSLGPLHPDFTDYA